MYDKTQQALEVLEQGLKQLLESENWSEFLTIQSKFHSYSFNNTLMILMQQPEASYVAGFGAWKKLGRHVKKGEKGIAIFAPLIGKKERTEEKVEPSEVAETLQQSEPTTKKVLYGFRLVYVYDISQTEGKPFEIPNVRPTILQGDVGWYNRICEACPFPVQEAEDLGGANGHILYRPNGHLIEILKSLPEMQKAKTTLHEWSHGLLHSPGTTITTEVRELEAESTAFVVANALGFDTSEYTFGYVAGWAGEDAVSTLKQCGSRIQRAANQILSVLLPQTNIEKEAV